MENFEAIARVVYEKNMPLGEYLLKIMKEYILPLNLRKETEEIIERVKNEKREKKSMLAVVEMIEKENQFYIRKDYEQAKKEFEKERQSYVRKGYKQAKREFVLLLLERKTPIEEISEITGLSTAELETIKKENVKILDELNSKEGNEVKKNVKK